MHLGLWDQGLKYNSIIKYPWIYIAVLSILFYKFGAQAVLLCLKSGSCRIYEIY